MLLLRTEIGNAVDLTVEYEKDGEAVFPATVKFLVTDPDGGVEERVGALTSAGDFLNTFTPSQSGRWPIRAVATNPDSARSGLLIVEDPRYGT